MARREGLGARARLPRGGRRRKRGQVGQVGTLDCPPSFLGHLTSDMAGATCTRMRGRTPPRRSLRPAAGLRRRRRLPERVGLHRQPHDSVHQGAPLLEPSAPLAVAGGAFLCRPSPVFGLRCQRAFLLKVLRLSSPGATTPCGRACAAVNKSCGGSEKGWSRSDGAAAVARLWRRRLLPKALCV